MVDALGGLGRERFGATTNTDMLLQRAKQVAAA